jgi:hypothetical protein
MKGTMSWIGVPTDDPACELTDLLLGCSSSAAEASYIPDLLRVLALDSLVHHRRLAEGGTVANSVGSWFTFCPWCWVATLCMNMALLVSMAIRSST